MVHVSLPDDQIRPLRRSEFEQLIDLGAFENERVELLYGRLVWLSPQGIWHQGVIQRLTKLLVIRLSDRAAVRVQLPLAGPAESRPEPDIAVAAPSDYLDAIPETALWIIEIDESSLDKDREIKGKLYASMGVPEYWIINLVEKVIEVYTQPRDGSYQKVERHGRGAELSPAGFPDLTLRSGDLLPG